MLIRRDGNISHLFISLATQRSMGKGESKYERDKIEIETYMMPQY